MKDNFKVQQNINSVPITIKEYTMPAKFKIPKWIIEDRKLNKSSNVNNDDDSKEV